MRLANVTFSQLSILSLLEAFFRSQCQAIDNGYCQSDDALPSHSLYFFISSQMNSRSEKDQEK